jgi:hypothetical protein
MELYGLEVVGVCTVVRVLKNSVPYRTSVYALDVRTVYGPYMLPYINSGDTNLKLHGAYQLRLGKQIQGLR